MMTWALFRLVELFLVLCIQQLTAESCTSFNDKCELIHGISFPNTGEEQSVALTVDKDLYLFFTVPPDTLASEFVASIVFGKIDIFGSRNEPSITASEFSSSSSAGIIDEGVMRMTSLVAGETINLLVRATDNARFSLMLSSPGIKSVLSPGVLQHMEILKDETAAFSFAPPSNDRQTISLNVLTGTITPTLIGPPPLHRKIDFPLNEIDDQGSKWLEFETHANEVGKAFTLSLASATDSVCTLGFSTGAKSSSTILLAGYDVRGHNKLGELRRYTVMVPPTASDVSMFLNVIQGRAKMFVNTESEGWYDDASGHAPAIWTSSDANGHSQKIDIPASDTNFITQGGRYFITIVPESSSVDYFVSSRNKDVVATLAEGGTLDGHVTEGAYFYVRQLDSRKDMDIAIDVFSFSGYVDLYVACKLDPTGTDQGYPSRSDDHYSLKTRNSYSEHSLLVGNSDPTRCSGPVIYYAVRGSSDAEFSLTVMYTGGKATLRPGTPVAATVFIGQSKFYRLKSGREQEALQITLTPEYGDPDLFVSVGEAVTTSEFDFKSNQFGKVKESIYIPELSMCTECWVNILVFGYSTSRFTLLATPASEDVVLLAGNPVLESVALNRTQYYSFACPIGSKGYVTIVLSMLDFGQPDLYVSAAIQRPDLTTSDTSVFTFDDNGNLPIMHLAVPGDDKSYSTVYAAVRGAHSAASYTIRASFTYTNGMIPLLKLLEGIPQNDAVGESDSTAEGEETSTFRDKYYQVTVDAGHQTIIFRVTTVIGRVNMKARRCAFTGSDCAESALPDDDNNLLDDIVDEQQETVVRIKRDDSQACSYIFKISSRSYYAEYTVSRGFEDVIMALQPGIPIQSSVSKGAFDYYTFQLEQEDQRIRISVTPLSGDPDLFVSTTHIRPNGINSTWASAGYGTEIVSIDTTADIEACIHCRYFVGVQGSQAAHYSIAVALHSVAPQTIIEGSPLGGMVEYQEAAYFVYRDVYGEGRNFKIELSVTSGDPDVYVTLDGSLPTATNYGYRSINYGPVGESIRIHEEDAIYRESPCVHGPCTLRIAVLGYSRSTSAFDLRVTSSQASSMLTLASPLQGDIANGTYEYYTSLFDSTFGASAKFHLTLTAQSGHIEAYLSCVNPFPSATSFEWKLDTDESSQTAIQALDLIDHKCGSGSPHIYISVFGKTLATYQILAELLLDTEDSAITLLPSISTRSSVGEGQMRYFFCRPGPAWDDAQISLTLIHGSVELYISQTWDERALFDRESNAVAPYLLKSARHSVAGGYISIDHQTMSGICTGRDFCYFVVAVLGRSAGTFSDGGVSGSSFDITLSYTDSQIVLSSGVPTRRVVHQGREDYFMYQVTNPDADVIVSLTAFSGDPDAFLSQSNKHPSLINSTWRIMSIGSDSLTIQATNLNSICRPLPQSHKYCPLFITVSGYHNSSYSLMVSMDEGFVSPMILVEGQPQSGEVKKHRYRYYSYTISEDSGHVYDGMSTLPGEIIFTLTPTDSGDQDLYVSMDENEEPGEDSYDFRSINFAGQSEEVVIRADMKKYCLNCRIFVAVFGSTAGQYRLSASVKGLTVLQTGQSVGGHVEEHRYRYYSFINTDPIADITISVTAIQGDPDIYINAVSAGQLDRYPTVDDFMWRSIHAGDDLVEIKYLDRYFCSDCEYIIAINGFHNATFNLMATTTSASVVSLVSNHPLTLSARANSVRHFTFALGTSTEDVTISLTALNEGRADLYITVLDLEQEEIDTGKAAWPTSSDSSSYQFSTHSSGHDTLVINGPHPGRPIFLIAVEASSVTKYTILAAVSQSPVVLQAGMSISIR
jgi:hypothetical protein